MKTVNCSKPGNTNLYITCSKIEHIPYNLICTKSFNDSSILVTIISWDYLNLTLANEYVGDVTIPTQVIKYNQFFSPGGSAKHISIHIKSNYNILYKSILGLWIPSNLPIVSVYRCLTVSCHSTLLNIIGNYLSRCSQYMIVLIKLSNYWMMD